VNTRSIHSDGVKVSQRDRRGPVNSCEAEPLPCYCLSSSEKSAVSLAGGASTATSVP
jgi:hypothetical protein